ncbi:MAG: hypothetical protein LBG42_00360, partial [Treponema sp.]|nr:hypothetical protein [Treponema sp.]
MIRKTVLLLIVMVGGIIPAFTQSGGAGFPEPVLAEPVNRTGESGPALGLWFSDFNDVVYYLWDYI